MNLHVESSIDTHGDVQPRAFLLGSQHIEVLQIIDRWLAFDYGYFKVAADDGGTYILRHDDLSDQWELTLFSADSL
ncbi:MAG: hypothetical protein V7606_5042 [Burkholderiales bacterium]|jgi:hypothetical protein|nr:hypothetical protein [Burkholderia sp.]